MAQLILKPGRERSLQRRHPWLFEGAVERLEGRARSGDTVEVVAADGGPLGKAAWSPISRIRARMWSFNPSEIIDDAFFKRRVAAALARRAALPGLAGQQGLRLIHAESDGLPGVICDRYGDTLVLAFSSAGAEKWRGAITAALQKATGCVRIYERSDADLRTLEGLATRCGWLQGAATNEPLVFDEHGISMEVDVVAGHKTGFYLDQRDNRLLTRELASGRRVLNCFCYTGGFSLQALAGGATRVLSLDSSGPALETARRNLILNPKLNAELAEWREADVFDELRALRAAGEKFDLIVLDPPKFAPSPAHAEKASRAYKDINLNAFKLLTPGGLLMTYSCSGGIGIELFQKIVAGAALDAGVDARIVRRLTASADHPVLLDFPEGEYLKGLVCTVG
ncbi:MAG: class I SAM-dependent methyltransferase [Proteobacteria bacterium]|nr:class I SAM-dependent methyltransferase [Pseudomonadota bacterium]